MHPEAAASDLHGGLLVIREIWRSERGYFYEEGYFDKQMFFSDIIHWMTWMVGLGLVAGAVPAAQAMRLRIVEALRRE